MLIVDRSSPRPGIVQDPDVSCAAQVKAKVAELSQATPDDPLTIRCMADAVLGLVTLLGHSYLILVTKSVQVGQIAGHPIYCIGDTHLLPLGSASAQAQAGNNKDHLRLRQLFRGVDLCGGDFYFSYSYDLTRSLQFNSNRARTSDSNHHYCNLFTWNFYLAQSLLDHLPTASDWVPALVHGFFSQIANVDVAGFPIDMTLIARRSRRFAGTRYNRRGISPNGFVANHVESELIVSVSNRQRLYDRRKPVGFCSIVLVRGSIPLFWAQDDPFSPRPEIKITKREQNYASTLVHFRSLIETFGAPVICLSLIKTKEGVAQETVVGNQFEESVAELCENGALDQDSLLYKSFDLLQAREQQRHVVSEISNLIAALSPQVTFFSIPDIPHLYSTPKVELCPDSEQVGVLRVNCIDCLDRYWAGDY